METISIQDILKTIPLGSEGTEYSVQLDTVKRQLVVTAVLELYRANAMGSSQGSSFDSNLGSNLANIEDHILLIMHALEPDRK